MATLVIITHEYDNFLIPLNNQRGVTSPYLLFGVLQLLPDMGHTVRIGRGPNSPPGDVAFYHVDTTVPPPEYVELQGRYERNINFQTGDISKRKISRLILAAGDPWDGPVIVKANYNNRAIVEDYHNQVAARAGRPLPHPGITKGEKYRVLPSLTDVGDEVWNDPMLVVEKFVAEPDEDGFALRTWVFMGGRERCTRLVTAEPISKAGGVIKNAPVAVPEGLRAERDRLGFDFGKFDFVMHEGEPFLLDANRTPGISPAIGPMLQKGAPNLAEGLHELMSAAPR